MGKLLISFVLCLAMAGPALAQSTSSRSKSSSSSAASLKSDEFSTEAAAKSHCPGDTVVWATLSGRSHAYHLSGDRYYGKTKRGAYMCEKDAQKAGMHQARSRTASSSSKKSTSSSATH
jgi:plastocyanin